MIIIIMISSSSSIYIYIYIHMYMYRFLPETGSEVCAKTRTPLLAGTLLVYIPCVSPFSSTFEIRFLIVLLQRNIYRTFPG